MKKIVLCAVAFSLISGVSYASQKTLDDPKAFLDQIAKPSNETPADQYARFTLEMGCLDAADLDVCVLSNLANVGHFRRVPGHIVAYRDDLDKTCNFVLLEDENEKREYSQKYVELSYAIKKYCDTHVSPLMECSYADDDDTFQPGFCPGYWKN